MHLYVFYNACNLLNECILQAPIMQAYHTHILGNYIYALQRKHTNYTQLYTLMHAMHTINYMQTYKTQRMHITTFILL